jgi:predicted RNA-binding protein YlxR (DUF448 family)
MTAKHVPLRRCVACRRSRPQRELIRFYRDAAGAWHLDETGRAGGRGAWLCRDEAACHTPKRLKRFFGAAAEPLAGAVAAHLSEQAAAPAAANAKIHSGGMNA